MPGHNTHLRRRTPKPDIDDRGRIMEPDYQPDRSYWSEVWVTFGFPAVMFAVAIAPALNGLYSGHGGLAWFIAPLCSPWIALRALLKTTIGPEVARGWYRNFFKWAIPAYIVLALPLSWAATASIQEHYGLLISTWFFFAMMVSPLPWLYFT